MLNKKIIVIVILITGVVFGGWWLGQNLADRPLFDSFACGQETITDIDGHIYETVRIGRQCWLRENLKTTRFTDGEAIPRPLSNDDWRVAGNRRQGAYACYDNEDENCQIYGALYNIYAVDRGLCPAGWQVPSDEDWKELEVAIGLKPTETDRLYWRGEPLGVTLAGHYELWEEEGFRDQAEFGRSGLDLAPAGYRMSGGVYSWLGKRANVWSSTIKASAMRRTIISGSSGGIRRTAAAKNFGFSVRCIKD